MKEHPKHHKTSKTATKKLLYETVHVTMKIIYLIGLYFYSLLEPFYEHKTYNFIATTTEKPQKQRNDCDHHNRKQRPINSRNQKPGTCNVMRKAQNQQKPDTRNLERDEK